MFQKIQDTIQSFDSNEISEPRAQTLAPLIEFIQSKIDAHQKVSLHFICTHNSRRSHLAQIWAQAMAKYFQIKDIFCYSGGTEVTALFPKIAETLEKSGFIIDKAQEEHNPTYRIQYSNEAPAIVAYSKLFNDPTNPSVGFAAILTCSHADDHCPFISGAEQRIPVTYSDPKIADNTAKQEHVYFERSIEIAKEMYYTFSQLTQNK